MVAPKEEKVIPLGAELSLEMPGSELTSAPFPSPSHSTQGRHRPAWATAKLTPPPSLTPRVL